MQGHRVERRSLIWEARVLSVHEGHWRHLSRMSNASRSPRDSSSGLNHCSCPGSIVVRLTSGVVDFHRERAGVAMCSREKDNDEASWMEQGRSRADGECERAFAFGWADLAGTPRISPDSEVLASNSRWEASIGVSSSECPAPTAFPARRVDSRTRVAMLSFSAARGGCSHVLRQAGTEAREMLG